ncbi:glutaredoxin family protein [Bacteroidota bacterium]
MRKIIFLFFVSLSMVSFSQDLGRVSGSLTTTKESKTMIVYGSDTCHYCLDAKAYLKENKINFIYYDVDVNILKQREMLIKIQEAGLSVDNLSLPVIHKDGEIFMNNGDFDIFLKKLKVKK